LAVVPQALAATDRFRGLNQAVVGPLLPLGSSN